MNSAVKVKRTIVGITKKNLPQRPSDSNDTDTCDHSGYMKQDSIRQKVFQKSRYDSQNTLRMENSLGMSPPRTISPSTSLSNVVNDCEDKSHSFSTFYKNRSINHDHSERYCEWKANDGFSDRRQIISDRSRFAMNSIQTEKSYNTKQAYNGLVSWFEHSNDEASKTSFHRSNDAFAKSLKEDEEKRIHDFYTAQINDILLNRQIQSSSANHQQQRRCSIDLNGLIQAFEIGELDPFEPTPY